MKKIALSPGDPAGIGPEICLKSLQEINNSRKKNFSLSNVDGSPRRYFLFTKFIFSLVDNLG